MRKIKIRAFILATLVIIFVLGALGFFFNFYTTTLVEEKVHSVTIDKTQTQANLISDIITDEYNYLKTIVDEKVPAGTNPSDYLKLLLDLGADIRIIGKFSPYSMNRAGLLSNTALIYPNMVQEFRDNHIILTERKNMIQTISENKYEIYYSFPFGEDYLIFVRDLDAIVDRIMQEDPGYYYLITTFGNIVAEKNEPTLDAETLFYNVVREGNNERKNETLKQGIQSRTSGSTSLTFNNESQLVYYANLLDGDTPTEYTFVYVKSQTQVANELQQIVFLTYIYGGSIMAIFLVVIAIVFFSINKRTYEFESAHFSYANAKTFVLSTNRRGIIKYCNKAVKAKIKGMDNFRNMYELSGRNENILDLIKRQQPFVLFFRTPDELDLYIRFVSLRKRGGYMIIGSDVTEETLDLNRARNLALYNPMTKLPNNELLSDDITAAIKNKRGAKAALLVFDIVNFRNINRIFGRVVGDNVLTKVAQIVEGAMASNEKVYHLEVDNFAILVTNIENYTMAIDTVKKVSKLFDRAITINSNLLAVKVKFGIYNFEESEYNRVDFAKYALINGRLALKKAKESRQIEFSTYDISIGQVLTRDMVMESDLKIAIEKNEFEMYYQPQYSLALGKIVGLEALIRWNNYKYTNESPEKYIRMAEQNGMIIPIGKYVIEQTFKMAKELESENIKISLNISPVQLLQSGFVRDVDDCARRNQINYNNICIEITETSLIEGFTEIVDKLKLLKDLGFSIHLDDFGTGYSSMLYLKELPVDTIKVDREFVKTIAYDQYSRAIVSKVIALAKSLDLNVIVEGVETEEQSQIVYKSGATTIQGYLISKPVPVSEIREVIKKFNNKTRK